MAIIWRSTFTAADGTNVTSITPEVGGALLTVPGGVLPLQVTADRARTNTGDNYSICQTPPLGANANYIVRAIARQITSASFSWKLHSRALWASGNVGVGYELYYEPGFLRLRANDGSGWVVLGTTTSFTGSNGVDCTVELVCNGNQISAAINGTTRLGPFTNTLVSGANAAVLEVAESTGNQATAGWHWDSFEVDTIGGSGPTPAPSFGRYGVRGPVR
jgi:hypothetical protein